MKDYQREVEDGALSREELAAAAKEAERKAKTLEAEVMQMHEDLASSERGRKAVENERDEMQDEVNNAASSK